MTFDSFTASTVRSFPNRTTAASSTEPVDGGFSSRSGYIASIPIARIASSATARLPSSAISELIPSCLVELGAVIPLSPSVCARYSRPVLTRMSLSAR